MSAFGPPLPEGRWIVSTQVSVKDAATAEEAAQQAAEYFRGYPKLGVSVVNFDIGMRYFFAVDDRGDICAAFTPAKVAEADEMMDS